MSPLAKLHTQLTNLQDHIQALRMLASAGGDTGIVQLTGTQIDRLLAPVDDGVCDCIETLEDAADATAKARTEAKSSDGGALSDEHGMAAGTG